VFPEFSLDPQNENCASKPNESKSAWPDEAAWEHYVKTRLKPEEMSRLERLLLERLKQRKGDVAQALKTMSDRGTYEDHFYRYYHGSFKVYHVQATTEHAVNLLRELLPERELNLMFDSSSGMELARFSKPSTTKIGSTIRARCWKHSRTQNS